MNWKRTFLYGAWTLVVGTSWASIGGVQADDKIVIDVQVSAPKLVPLVEGAVISVTLYGSPKIDVRTIDLSTLRLSGAEPISVSFSDEDGDTVEDLVADVDVSTTNLTSSSTTITVTGSLKQTGQPLSGSDTVSVVFTAVRVHATLHTVNQPRSPSVCPNGAPTCKMPLFPAELRVFRQPGPPPDPSTWVVLFQSGTHVGGCETGLIGTCYAGVPAPGNYEVILRWSDPLTGASVYTEHSVNIGDFSDGVATRITKLIRQLRHNGTIMYHGDKVVVVTG
jgi:hypothetical protein